jgi:hypothetical protein
VMACMRSLLARLIGHTIASETATSAWRGCETMVYKRGRVALHDSEYRPYRNHEAHIENLLGEIEDLQRDEPRFA